MNAFKKYIPEFMNTDIVCDWIPFETTKDLFELEVIKNIPRENNFSHYAMNNDCLMEITDDGFNWWIIGYIKYPDIIDLPKWNGAKYRVETSNGEKIILTNNEILSVSGKKIKLHDGSIAKELSKREFTFGDKAFVLGRLRDILIYESGMSDKIGVCIWRYNEEQGSNWPTYDYWMSNVGSFLCEDKNQSGDWLIDGGWGGPPGPIRVHWDEDLKQWVSFGFPPWDGILEKWESKKKKTMKVNDERYQNNQ